MKKLRQFQPNYILKTTQLLFSLRTKSSLLRVLQLAQKDNFLSKNIRLFSSIIRIKKMLSIIWSILTVFTTCNCFILPGPCPEIPSNHRNNSAWRFSSTIGKFLLKNTIPSFLGTTVTSVVESPQNTFRSLRTNL